MIGILSCIFALSGAFAKNHHEEPTIWGPYNYDNGEKAIGMGVIEKCVKPGMVALTFDDGVSDYTPQLLRILRSEGILATFFVLGETLDSSNSDARKNRQVLKEMWMSGHDIGNHSYDHEAFPSLSLDDVEWQMEKTNELIADVIEAYPTLMRLPYGSYTSSVVKKLQSMGYVVVQWNVDSDDWRVADRSPPYLAEHVADMIPRNRGDTSYIVLQHDIHRNTIENQLRIIRDLKQKGYKLVSMTECLGFPKLYRRKH